MIDSRKRVALKGAKVFQHGASWPGSAATLLLEDQRIIAILPSDSEPDCEETIQLPGGVLLPAFFDAHIHLDQGGRYLGMLQLRDIDDSDEVLRVVAEGAKQQKAGWLIGIGLRETSWPALGDLHHASSGRPCLLYTRDYHTAFVNREAMVELSLTTSTTLPEGGWVDLDEAGDPNGVLHENAVMWAERQLPPESVDQQRQNILRAQDYLLQLGIVGVSDAGHPDSWSILKSLEAEGLLEVYIEQWLRCLDFREEILDAERLSSDRLKRCRIKLFIDGALGSRTAWMKDEYNDKPGWTGEPVPKLEVFEHFVRSAVKKEWGLTVHAIGDAGVEYVTKLLIENPSDAVRHRIEHVQHSDPDTIQALRDSAAISSVQPLHRSEDKAMLLDRVGSQRADWAFPLRSLRQSDGNNLVVGTDWPVVSLDPRDTMKATLAVRNKDEGVVDDELTVEQALQAYSLEAARVAGFHQTGDLLAGLDANVLWLPEAPGRDPEEWSGMEIGAIWHRGRLIVKNHDL
ncbi:amidohydrolase family protein [bacterium]|nr:amidohydrolase family protein [bacterium]